MGKKFIDYSSLPDCHERIIELEGLRDDLVQACEGLIAACKHHKVLTGTMIFAEEVIAKAKA